MHSIDPSIDHPPGIYEGILINKIKHCKKKLGIYSMEPHKGIRNPTIDRLGRILPPRKSKKMYILPFHLRRICHFFFHDILEL